MTHFVSAEFPRLVRALDLYVGDIAVAEELAQEALLRTCMRWERVRMLESPGGWTHRVAMNLATSHLRRRQAERRASRRLPVPPETTDDSLDAERAAVRAAVLALPGKQRAAVIARYFLGMSALESAATLRSTPEAVRAATARAVVALRRDLGDDLSVDVGEERADA